MYKNIVVGTDGSDTAKIAVQHALELARLGGATLHIVHAYQDVSLGMAALSAGSGGPVVDLDRLNVGLADHGTEVLDEASAQCAAVGVKAETHLVRSDPADALLGVATNVGADLLVVGNRGMSGVKRLLLGSVPNRISHHTPCSLLIVHTVD
jgi:nucleotide-binding universal stress UspA family protein